MQPSSIQRDTMPESEPNAATDALPNANRNKKIPLGWFITGTDTEVGKTLVSSALLLALSDCGLRAAGMKPVAAGAALRDGVWHNDDADELAAAASLALPQSLTTPYLLQEAAAPHIAAGLEGIAIEPTRLLAAYHDIAAQADAVVVEGVGGFRVPLSDTFDTADLASQLGLPVILVVGLRLGCISHALLTADAIAARGLTLAGWVANRIDPAMPHADANIAALAARLPAPLLGTVPRLDAPSLATTRYHPTLRNATIQQSTLQRLALQYLDFSCLPAWPGTQSVVV